MLRKLNIASVLLSVMTIAVLSSFSSVLAAMRPTATPTPLSVPTTGPGSTPRPKIQRPNPTTAQETLRPGNDPRNQAPTVGTGGSPGGPTGRVVSPDASAQTERADWDGKVQGKLIATAVNVRFSSSADYDNFAAGKLPVNILLKNLRSGASIRSNGEELVRSFTPSRDKSEITIFVVIDNLGAPLGDWERCLDTRLSAENGPDGNGVNVTLTYDGCGSSSSSGNGLLAQRSGQPVRGINVNNPKNRGGDLSISAGPNQIVTREAAARLGHGPNETVFLSGKGTGSTKAQGF